MYQYLIVQLAREVLHVLVEVLVEVEVCRGWEVAQPSWSHLPSLPPASPHLLPPCYHHTQHLTNIGLQAHERWYFPVIHRHYSVISSVLQLPNALLPNLRL